MSDDEMVNSIGSLNLCKLASKKRCNQFIYISSISSLDNDENEYFNSYGISKKHAEENIRFFCNSNNIEYTILRFSQIYDSKGMAKKHQGMLYRLIEKTQRGEAIEIYGTKDPRRNYIYIDDVVEIIKRCIDQSVEGEFNCVSTESYKISEAIELIAKVTKNEAKMKFISDKEELKSIYIPEDSMLYNIINYSPQISFADGVKKIINLNQ